MKGAAPLPPLQLMLRVGCPPGLDPADFYQREGVALRERIASLLPPGWVFEGKRVLDFGCGSGRVLRQFLGEAEHAEFWGCDLDASSIDWMKRALAPPLHVFQNELRPPLAQAETGYFDLAWAMSVFTHIEAWSEWLLEMHRILAPGGLLIASWLGEGMYESLLREPYRGDEIGMTVLRRWEPGGAWVFHSEWWLREHWGRAFEVLEVMRPPRAPDGSPVVGHSYILLRRRDGGYSPAELERIDPDEPRELIALQTSLRLMRSESIGVVSGLIKVPGLKRTRQAARIAALRRMIGRTRLAPPLRRLRDRVRR